MCIKQTTTWAYGGTNYDSELEAVKAALTDLGSRFVKEFHSKPLEGMLVLGADISALRTRYIDLTAPTVQAEEAPSEEPEGTRGDPSVLLSDASIRRRFLAIPDHSPIHAAVRQWLADRNYVSIEQACRNVNPKARRELSALIGIAKEPGA